MALMAAVDNTAKSSLAKAATWAVVMLPTCVAPSAAAWAEVMATMAAVDKALTWNSVNALS